VSTVELKKFDVDDDDSAESNLAAHSEKQNENQIMKGLIIKFIAEIFFTGGIICVKTILLYNKSISVYEILYWKSFSMMFINYGFCKLSGVLPVDVPKNYRLLIVIRALVGFTGISNQWASLKYMPVSTANCICST
jgi:drug/metabolite transporter (DMT)-like permease